MNCVAKLFIYLFFCLVHIGNSVFYLIIYDYIPLSPSFSQAANLRKNCHSTMLIVLINYHLVKSKSYFYLIMCCDKI